MGYKKDHLRGIQSFWVHLIAMNINHKTGSLHLIPSAIDANVAEQEQVQRQLTIWLYYTIYQI